MILLCRKSTTIISQIVNLHFSTMNKNYEINSNNNEHNYRGSQQSSCNLYHNFSVGAKLVFNVSNLYIFAFVLMFLTFSLIFCFQQQLTTKNVWKLPAILFNFIENCTLYETQRENSRSNFHRIKYVEMYITIIKSF